MMMEMEKSGLAQMAVLMGLIKRLNNLFRIPVKDGLPDNYVIGILADENGNLWLSTKKGICKFTPPSFENRKAVCRNYDMSDGLPGDEYDYNACVKGNDGTFYFSCKGHRCL